MNTLINYFESPTKSMNMLKNEVSPKLQNEDTSKEECKDSKPNLESSNLTNKTKNQEIVKNMEEVLKSVKKKHKSKHKHESSKKYKHHKHHKNKSNENGVANISGTSPLKENQVNSNKKVKKHNKSSTKTILDLLSPTKKTLQVSEDVNSMMSKNIQEIQIKNISEDNGIICNTSESVQVGNVANDLQSHSEDLSVNQDLNKNEKVSEQKKKVNAFEFLMNARNKSIGGNSPGKEENCNEEMDQKSKINNKRKLLLEEWADRKGAKKRKIDEEAREQYIEEQMDKRAKRLKEMIKGQLPKVKKTNLKISRKKEKVEIEKIESKKSKIQKRKSDTVLIVEDQNDEKEGKSVRRSIRNSEKLAKDEIKSPKDEIKSPKDEIKSPKDEFPIDLASPIKKRDNLYGYFEKTTPSPTEKEINKTSNIKKQHKSPFESDSAKVVKKRGRKKKVKNLQEETPKSTLNESNDKTEISKLTPNDKTDSSPTGRPRRSCVGKIRFEFKDYDMDSSQERSNRKRNKRLNCTNDEEEDVILVDCSSNSLDKDENFEPKKLAPLFVKNIPKVNVDPERVKARQDFLMSGMPEKMKLEIAKIKQFEENYETYDHFFPKFNHVPNWIVEETSTVIDWKRCNIIWRNEENTESGVCSYLSGKINSMKNILILKEVIPPLLPLLELKHLENKRLLIKEWKNLFERFPTFKCYNQFREKYRYFSAMDTTVDTHQVSDTFVVSTSRSRETTQPDFDSSRDCIILENVKPPSSAPNGELLFTDKYKPLVLDQILVNITPVNLLKEFLSNWQSRNGNMRTDESMNCFDDSVNDSNSVPEMSNSIVLVGPRSSGKTNAVFALANELHFNVLEINAGMKRSGKKLLQDLQEATQSHQIRKNSKNTNDLVKRSLGGLTKNNRLHYLKELEKSAKMSLILVEDADILFDNYDQGFVDALYQLASSSKRPVVLLANDKKCSHLQRLINQNCIEFDHPNCINISKYLSILSLMENCPILLDDVVSLYYFNKMDLRKTILEIQFFIQSGGDRRILNENAENNLKSPENNLKSPTKAYFASPKKVIMEADSTTDIGKQECELKEDSSQLTNSNFKTVFDPNDFHIHKQLFEFFTLPQNVRHKIPFPMNFDLLWININEIFNVSNVCDIDSTDRSIKNEHEKELLLKSEKEKMENLVDFYNNISLASNINHYTSDCCLNISIEGEISHSLVEKSISSLMEIDELSYNLFDERPNNVESIHSLISSTYNPRTKNSIALDFEPMLRSICRSERAKSLQRRPGSRYYHYLRNISSSLNSDLLEDLEDITLTFVDDPENFIELKQPCEIRNNEWLDR